MKSLYFSLILTTCLMLPMISSVTEASERDPAILYIGDSISHGQFGHAVDAELRKLSSNVYTNAECGTTPAAFFPKSEDCAQPFQKTVCGFWEKGPHSEDSSEKENARYLKTHPGWDPEQSPLSHHVPLLSEQLRVKPKVTIVQLGTNIAVDTHPGAYQKKIHDMMVAIKNSGSACIWIAPPNAHSRKVTRENLIETDRIIRLEAAEHDCYYERSLVFVHMAPIKGKKHQGDGIHPDDVQSSDWASRVTEKLIPKIKAMINL